MDKGRMKIAVVAMVCVLAVLALPTFAFAASGPTGTVTASSVKVTFDAATPLKKTGASIDINGTKYFTTVSGNTAYTYAGPLTDGLKTVTANAFDMTNAAVPGTWDFTVSVAPKFGTVIPANGQKFTTAPTAISFAASDNSAVTVFSATVNGIAAAVTLNGGTGRYDVAVPALGSHNVVVATVGDAAGNSTLKTWSFDVPVAAVAEGCASNNCHDTAIAAGHAYNDDGRTVSGHNVGGQGINSAKTKFDGSQGVTLKWKATQSFTITSILTASATDGISAVAVAPGTSFTAGQEGTVTSNWALPTKSVFWPAADPDAPSTAMTGLNFNSVITCEDCHTGLNASGPHGIASNFGLDANYPADYSLAGLTKKVTNGEALGGIAGRHSYSGIFVGTTGATAATKMSGTSGYMDGTSGTYGVICAKCHKLMTTVPAGSGPGTSGLPYPVVIGASTPHNSHHQDGNTGQCVSCHVAIPHGWKAPRLLVDVPKYEGTPWVSENAVEDMGTIAGLNNHPVIGADGDIPYTNNGGAKPANNVALSGTVLWDEGQCDACADHYGNDLTKGATMDPVTGGNTYAVPVRIDF